MLPDPGGGHLSAGGYPENKLSGRYRQWVRGWIVLFAHSALPVVLIINMLDKENHISHLFFSWFVTC
mgnify:FL=1